MGHAQFVKYGRKSTSTHCAVDPTRIVIVGFSDGASYALSLGLTHDRVLPIDRCSRRIVPPLERTGYAVQYHEFEGGHTVPPDIVSEALDWFLC
jgi:phospholipase/carboxylesterase